MKRRVLIVASVALGALTLGLVCAKVKARYAAQRWPYQIEGFSADFVEHDTHNPAKNCTGRIFVNRRAGGIRREMTYPDRQRILLIQRSAGLDVILDPASMTYWKPESKVRLTVTVQSVGGGRPPEPHVGGPDATRRYVGQELVNGRAAYRWEITEPDGHGSHVVWQDWEDARLQMSLKQVKEGSVIYEITNLREGRQSASMFLLPAGYAQRPPPLAPQ
jgi:hypothetical protein